MAWALALDNDNLPFLPGPGALNILGPSKYTRHVHLLRRSREVRFGSADLVGMGRLPRSTFSWTVCGGRGPICSLATPRFLKFLSRRQCRPLIHSYLRSSWLFFGMDPGLFSIPCPDVNVNLPTLPLPNLALPIIFYHRELGSFSLLTHHLPLPPICLI